MNTITRADLADKVYEEMGFSYAESSELVDSVLDEIISELAAENDVKLSLFGTFRVRYKKARMGRNPKTKQDIPISPRKVVTFHASNRLMDDIRNAT